MKNVLIRLMTLMIVSASLTSFATAGESKRHEASSSANSQQSGCASAAQEEKKQNKGKKADDRSEQEKEFDRVLMGIYG
jgi:hypothetical protein